MNSKQFFRTQTCTVHTVIFRNFAKSFIENSSNRWSKKLVKSLIKKLVKSLIKNSSNRWTWRTKLVHCTKNYATEGQRPNWVSLVWVNWEMLAAAPARHCANVRGLLRSKSLLWKSGIAVFLAKLADFSCSIMAYLKVSKFQKQIILSSHCPKHQRNFSHFLP